MRSQSSNMRRTAVNLAAACIALAQVGLPATLFAQAAQGNANSTGAGSATASASGFLSSSTGVVFVRRGDGPEVAAKVGDIFGPGTTFRTGVDSSAVLVFADGQNITLGPQSLLKVDDFRFDARDIKSSKATLGLMTGVMRLVTGGIHTGNREGLVVSAGSASIDILSKDVTAFVVEIDQKSLGIGAAAVTVGEIAIRTPAGPPVQLGEDQFTRWVSDAPPLPGIPLSAAPAVFQAVVAASLAKVIPSNAPIDIQSASVQATLAALDSTAAGSEPNLQAQAPESTAALVIPAATPGGGRGCVGSPC